jgi:hypothetical protein
MSDDQAYYSELELGAVYAADKATDADDRAKHLRMARIYGSRAREAAGMPRRILH